MSTSLNVFLDGTFVGVASQKNGAASFAYDPAYLQTSLPTPVSLAMPLESRNYSNRVVSAWLEGLLPDSKDTRERWGRQYSASANNPFSLLRHVGRDAAGAVQILPPDIDPPDAASRTGDVRWFSDDEFSEMLRDLSANSADWDPGVYGGRWSLAGAQAKIALHGEEATQPDGTTTMRWGVPRDSTPTTHIIKPSLDGFDDHHINEALCMGAARHLGLPAAVTTLIDDGELQAVISRRYDRVLSRGAWRRLHQEDMCQALSVQPSQKYQSDGGPGVGKIADLFGRLANREDREKSAQRFFQYLGYNALVGGTDAHAKNFSMLLAGPRAQIAPLYDVASAATYPQHQYLSAPMKLGASKTLTNVSDKNWQAVARRLSLNPDEAVHTITTMRERLPAALEAAIATMPTTVHESALRQAEQIASHAAGT